MKYSTTLTNLLMPRPAPILSAAMLEREVTVLNKLGLHARPAAEFVRAARAFKSTIKIRKNGEEYSASSILDVLSANCDFGSVMILVADGSDAEQALERLSGMMHAFKQQEEEG